MGLLPQIMFQPQPQGPLRGSCLLEEEPTNDLKPDRANESGSVPLSAFPQADKFVGMPCPRPWLGRMSLR